MDIDALKDKIESLDSSLHGALIRALNQVLADLHHPHTQRASEPHQNSSPVSIKEQETAGPSEGGGLSCGRSSSAANVPAVNADLESFLQHLEGSDHLLGDSEMNVLRWIGRNDMLLDTIDGVRIDREGLYEYCCSTEELQRMVEEWDHIKESTDQSGVKVKSRWFIRFFDRTALEHGHPESEEAVSPDIASRLNCFVEETLERGRYCGRTLVPHYSQGSLKDTVTRILREWSSMKLQTSLGTSIELPEVPTLDSFLPNWELLLRWAATRTDSSEHGALKFLEDESAHSSSSDKGD